MTSTQLGASRMNDLQGMNFGRLTVIERSHNQGFNIMWLCVCRCGNTKLIRGDHLKSGEITSCGCYFSERVGKLNTSHEMALTQDELKSRFRYDPETGQFWHLSEYNGQKRKDLRAGTIDAKGYLIIKIRGQGYKAHRLAWLYIHGVWPTSMIDHVDMNPANNRLSNLREATRSQNSWNSKIPRTSKTGIKGVHVNGDTGKYCAQITVAGKVIYLGLYDSLQEAARVVSEAREKLHGEFCRHA